MSDFIHFYASRPEHTCVLYFPAREVRPAKDGHPQQIPIFNN
jgi:hypothetical protein